jgi:hypothetical protein
MLTTYYFQALQIALELLVIPLPSRSSKGERSLPQGIETAQAAENSGQLAGETPKGSQTATRQ